MVIYGGLNEIRALGIQKAVDYDIVLWYKRLHLVGFYYKKIRAMKTSSLS